MASPEPDLNSPDKPSTDLAVIRPVRASLSEKMRYAEALACSGLLPAAYREKPANVLFSVEYGEMLGIPPMAAVNGIHIIDGKPTASAALMSALVRRAGHRLRVTGDDKRAVASIIRADDPEFTFESVWTIERAEQAKLTGKSVWKQYPAAMLKARAISEVARDACEEALSGVHYTAEELGAEVNEDGEVIQATITRDEPAPPRIDWDTEIQRLADDADGLAALWKQARRFAPQDVALHARIVEAGKAARGPAQPAEPEVVDAEIVDDQPAATPLAADDPVTLMRQAAQARGWNDDALTDDFIARMGEHPDHATDDQIREYVAKLDAAAERAA